MSVIRKIFPKIGFIGGGNISQAIISGLLKNNIDMKNKIMVSDPNHYNYYKKKQIPIFYDNSKIFQNSELIFLALKPNIFKNVQSELRKDFKSIVSKNPKIISVMAGISCETLKDTFQKKNPELDIIRCMPNTSSKINQGICVWYSESDKKIKPIQDLFKTLGSEYRVTQEDDINKATAITGSGPAYIYYMMESIIDAGIEIGLDRNLVTSMVIDTFKGSSDLVKMEYHNPIESTIMGNNLEHSKINHLKNMIISPNGTTSKALYELEKNRFKYGIQSAVREAYYHSIN